jgi:reversibly glycosylated polypeptide
VNTCVVVPTIREKSAQEFLEAWEKEFTFNERVLHETPNSKTTAADLRHVIIVEDNPERSFQLPDWVTHVSWKEIDADLKDDAWIIPRRTGAIRNYGNLLASRIPGLDMIVNLDDDCMPDGPRFLDTHWLALDTPGDSLPMFDTMESLGFGGCKPRGYPKHTGSARTVLNHGLWNGVPDIDGETQLETGLTEVNFAPQSRQVPTGVLFPMSAMNIAFRPELLPAMYNLPMGQGQPFHRFDDIWCGLIMKKVCDAMGWSVRSGSPCIRHVRASDAKRNAELEAPGIVENEKAWKFLAELQIDINHAGERFDMVILEQIHRRLSFLGSYWTQASTAASIWRNWIIRGVASQ